MALQAARPGSLSSFFIAYPEQKVSGLFRHLFFVVSLSRENDKFRCAGMFFAFKFVIGILRFPFLSRYIYSILRQ